MELLFEIHTIMPYPIEDVFALTINLEKAPRWHNIFTDVQQLTANPIGTGSRWKISYGVGNFMLEIIDYQPPHRVTFRGRAIMGIVANFTVELQAVTEGTRLRYLPHPDVSPLLKPFVKIVGTPYGKRDLERYFRELETMLAA